MLKRTTSTLTERRRNHHVWMITKTAGALGSTVKFYFDGVLQTMNSSTISTVPDTLARPIYLGAFGDFILAHIFSYDGRMYSAGVYARAFTQAEVTAAYNWILSNSGAFKGKANLVFDGDSQTQSDYPAQAVNAISPDAAWTNLGVSGHNMTQVPAHGADTYFKAQ